jgi:septum formation inhibitor-activating ATPase MinD
MAQITIREQAAFTYDPLRKIVHALLVMDMDYILAESPAMEKWLKLRGYNEELFTVGHTLAAAYVKRGEKIAQLQSELEEMKKENESLKHQLAFTE